VLAEIERTIGTPRLSVELVPVATLHLSEVNGWSIDEARRYFDVGLRPLEPAQEATLAARPVMA
jgi:hypothetical protein